MRQQIQANIDTLQKRFDWLNNNNNPPLLIADAEAILWLLLHIVIAMLKRELKRLA